MFQNHLKIALRNLWNQRFFTSLNLIGLAVGLAVSLTLAMYVKNESSFDRYHAKADRTYRVNLLAKWDDGEQKMATSPNITGPALKEGLKEVEAQVRILKHEFGKTAFVNYEEQHMTESSLYWADSSLFSVFDIPLMTGDPRTALNRPQTVILSETIARKIFKDNDPIGKTITVDNVDTLEVTGVFADLPANSTFDANIIGSFYSVEWANNNLYWSNASYETYLVLAKGTDPQSVARQANTIHEKATEADQRWFSLYLQPLTDIHLHATEVNGSYTSRLGDYQQVRMLGYLSLAVLLLACFNYVNMATARSQQRFREVGINKTLGASTSMMMQRFFTETGLVVATAMGLGLMLTLLALPFLNQLTDKGLRLSALLEGGWVWGLPMLWAAVTFGAGLYPAFFLSRFLPKDIMQANSAGGKQSGHSLFRQSLVVGQFVVCIGLMVATLVLYRQLNFISDKKLGFEPEQVVSINTSAATKTEQLDGLMNEYRNLAAVQSLCRAQTYPGKGGSGRSLNKPGAIEGQSIPITTNRVTPDFEKVLGLSLLTGKTVPLKDPKDTTTDVILNETAIKYMGWSAEEAIGKLLPDLFYMGPTTVVGVVKDFHHESLHQPITAYAFHNGNSESRPHLLVKLSTGDLRHTMTQLQDGFKQHLPGSAFDFTFIDDHLNTLYRNEQTLAKVVLLFSSMAIFIACLGLFGLAAFAAERRTKEIGIRKVLGATVHGLVGLMAKEFLALVILSLVISAPLAWLFMDHWLDNFAYRIDVSWSLFALAGLAAVAVAFFTVSFQSIKAALANPVKSLRSE